MVSNMVSNNDKAAFFGEITASATHELQNVLAIIKENAGLMEDILLMSQGSAPELGERLQKSLANIKKQVSRGVNLTSRLNGFSHTADHVETHINIYETLKRLIFLTGRITKLKEVEVAIEECEKQPSLLTDPVLFQITAYLCIKCLVDISKPKTNISVMVANTKTGTTIKFRSDNPDLQANDLVEKITSSTKWTEISNACRQINSKAEATAEASGIILTFF